MHLREMVLGENWSYTSQYNTCMYITICLFFYHFVCIQKGDSLEYYCFVLYFNVPVCITLGHQSLSRSCQPDDVSQLSALGFKGQNIGTMSRAGLIFFYFKLAFVSSPVVIYSVFDIYFMLQGLVHNAVFCVAGVFLCMFISYQLETVSSFVIQPCSSLGQLLCMVSF